MLDGKKLYIFLAGYFIMLLIPAYWLPLFETTDARYAEISREMLASGNFIEPFYNGVKHFHKPPFTYWINAFGMFIFGVNGFGARFFGALASVVILIYTRRTAFLLTGDRNTADTSVLVLGSSILFMVVSRVVSTDIYLAMFAIMTLFHLFSQIYGRKSMTNALLIGLYAGLGFLTKGPVIFLFTLLPFVVAKFFDRAHRRVFTISQGVAILIVFAAVALPWYAYVVSINDGLLEYFLYDQTVERVATDKFERSKPFYFFIGVFFGTFLPWAFFMFRNFNKTQGLKPGRALFLYVLMPFIIFQISTSKLGTYLLPFYPVAAILAALNTESRLLRRLTFVVMMALGLGFAVAPFLLDYLKPYMFYCIPAGVLIFTVSLHAFLKRTGRGFELSFTALALAAVLAVYCLIPMIGPYVKGYRMVAEDIKAFDPDGKYDILVYKTFVPSLSFYMNKVVPIAMARDREIQFQHADDYKRFYIADREELMEHLKTRKEIIILTRKEHMYQNFMDITGYNCELINIRGGKKYIAFCKSPDSAN